MPRSVSKSIGETPPLTRGRLPNHPGNTARRGNTPAYAGKTRLYHRAGPGLEKHPRLRGEDAVKRIGWMTLQETPPLTRGRQSTRIRSAQALGNTPAYAGKTSTPTAFTRKTRKHPRLRGEDRSRKTAVACRWGNTPAYAGKTQSIARITFSSGKHPRLRGEDLACFLSSFAIQETPPLTRGRLELRLRRYRAAGNTPAYAGKTRIPAF